MTFADIFNTAQKMLAEATGGVAQWKPNLLRNALRVPQASADYSGSTGLINDQYQTVPVPSVGTYAPQPGDPNFIGPTKPAGYVAPTGGTSGPGGAYPTSPSGGGGPSTEEQLAMSRYNNDLSTARSIREQGQQTFQTLLDSINKFRDRAQTGFNNAGQQIVDTASSTLGSNARTGQELLGTSRAMGRAMGLGDSSKFNAQNKVLANLGGTQGNVLATKGQNDRANTLNLQANNDVANTNESNANTYLKGVNDNVSNLENTAATTYGGNLDNIIQYQRQLAALQPLSTANVTTTTPNFSNVSNTLNGLLGGLVGGGTSGVSADTAANAFTSPSDAIRKLMGLK